MRRKRKKSGEALVSIVALIIMCIILVKVVIPLASKPMGAVYEEVMSDERIENAVDEVTSYLSVENPVSNEQAVAVVEEPAVVVADATGAVTGDEIIVEYIDVGQGDCSLIYDKTTDFVAMIDTGLYDAYDNVQATLSEYGIDKVNLLILTHPDTDHIQSAVDVIKDYNVADVCMSKAENPEAQAYTYLMDFLEDAPTGVHYLECGDTLTLGGMAMIAVLGPVSYDELTDTNGNSLVLKLINGNDSFLFVGDATGDEMDAVMSSSADLSADVLKASHHGSANDGCNSEKLFECVDPKTLVVSCGYQNDHGHPHKETMELVQKMNIDLYRTDLQGSISCLSNGDGISWSQKPTDVYTNGNGF